MPNHSKATFKMVENVMALLLTYVPKHSWCVIWRRQQPSSQFLPLNQRTESRFYVQCFMCLIWGKERQWSLVMKATGGLQNHRCTGQEIIGKGIEYLECLRLWGEAGWDSLEIKIFDKILYMGRLRKLCIDPCKTHTQNGPEKALSFHFELILFLRAYSANQWRTALA